MNIYILNTLYSGAESTDLIRKQINIDGIIGLNQDYSEIDSISGFYCMKSYCEENKLDFVGLKTYNMNDIESKQKLLSLKIDLLLVLGWQRLIPEWFIDKVSVACIGVHGSPWGIEGGRGRSPINWSLLLGKESFKVAIFKINNGIDAGDIIDEIEFKINVFDDVNSVYLKTSWSISQMIIKNIKNGSILNNSLKKQNTNAIRFLPKRTREDGEIDWHRNSIDIYNFIRAITKPYPGAFCILDDNDMIIWKSIPFELLPGFDEYMPGQIIKYYESLNYFIVKTNDSAILVTDYEFYCNLSTIDENKIFKSCNFEEQIKTIIQRHTQKYSHLPCNPELERLVKNQE